jgi:hypothetical protein
MKPPRETAIGDAMQLDKQQERLRQSGATMRLGPQSLFAKALAVAIGAALLVLGFAVSECSHET